MKRYYNSPFPLLSNLEFFSNTIGQWNRTLLAYGIKTREKYGDNPDNHATTGSQIFLSSYSTGTYRGNKYLKNQYKRLRKYRLEGRVNAYWKLSWNLMQHSFCYQLASLNSWKPLWYEIFTLTEVQKLFSALHSILNLDHLQTTIKNVWIESPKNKWRQLCIPPKVWRFYLHMLNQFLSFIYEPHLPSSTYTGFIYNRGCKSFWEDTIWGPFLTYWDSLMEVDVSSGFPNINLHSVREALLHDKLLPPQLINLILNYLKSPTTRASWFPNLESYIEDKENEPWRTSSRCLPMGIGICPILFVITMKYHLTRIFPQTTFLRYKWYADDGTIYFNLKDLYKLLLSLGYTRMRILWEIINKRNPLISYLNEHPEFLRAGITFCSKKSRLVKLYNVWLHPYISLGVKLYTPLTLWEQIMKVLQSTPIPLELSGWTRGRGANPSKGTTGTPPSRQVLNFRKSRSHPSLNYDLLKKLYKPYWGLLLSRLYGNHQLPNPSPRTFKSTSLWGYLLSQRSPLRLRKEFHLNPYNKGSKLLGYVLTIQQNESLPLSLTSTYPNMKRLLKLNWKSANKNLFTQSIPNPLVSSPSKDYKTDYFRKYSEINLSLPQYNKYKQEYINQCVLRPK